MISKSQAESRAQPHACSTEARSERVLRRKWRCEWAYIRVALRLDSPINSLQLSATAVPDSPPESLSVSLAGESRSQFKFEFAPIQTHVYLIDPPLSLPTHPQEKNKKKKLASPHP